MTSIDPYKPPEVRVDDPVVEGGPQAALARRFSRLAAVIVDGLAYAPVGVIMALGGGLQPDWDPGIELLLGILVGIGIFATNLYFLADRGQTLGKMVLRVRIVRSDGSRASLGRIFGLRMLLPGILTRIPVLGPIFGLLDALMIFREDRRCIHDHMADTIVVEA